YLVALSCSLVLLSGCALPGYDMDAGNGGYWYGADGNAEATWPGGAPPDEIKYDARMVLITPELIRHLRQQHAAVPLEPGVKALVRNTNTGRYQVGPGDVLQVIVFGQSQLNNPLGKDSAEGSVAGQ